MPYLYNGKTIRLSRAWVDDNGTQHPANWGKWSEEEKVEKGLVWQDEPPAFDSRFYQAHEIPKDLTILKAQAIVTCKEQAGSFLAKSDWYITRQAETGKTVPQEIVDYRQAVRDASDKIEAAIAACEDLESFIALHDAPVDEELNQVGNAPINDWPVDPEAEVVI